MTTKMYYTLKKEELVSLLEKQAYEATKEDRINAKKHKKEENKAFFDFKERLRKAMKWDYATAKSKAGNWRYELSMRPPACPRLESVRFSQLVQSINMDQRKSPYRIYEGSSLDAALKWVPKSKAQPTTVCG